MKWLKTLAVLIVWFVSIVYVYGIGALAGKFNPQLAERSMTRAAGFLSLFMGDFTPCGDAGPLQCGFQDITARTEVNCADYQGERSAVLMTFGQSNSANAGKDRYIPVGSVANFNFHDGKCYKAEDPLLGPDGEGGSVWGVLADKMIASGDYEKVLLVPFGIGGSALSQWQSDGFLYPILEAATAAVKEHAIEPTHVLWHQGESDAGSATSEEEYFSMFQALLESLRSNGINAPVIPAIATHCQMPYLDTPPEAKAGQEAVRAAQQRLPELEGVYAGPDTDSIQGMLHRHDNCHFNAKGMQEHARLWQEALNNSRHLSVAPNG